MRIDRNQVRTLAIVGTLTAAFVGAMWLPRKVEESRLREQIASIKQQIESDNTAGKDLKRLSEEVSKLKQEDLASNRKLAKEEEVADILRQLSTDLQAQRTREQETNTQTITDGADFSTLPIAVSFRGSCASMFDFLKSVEQGSRLMRVTRIQMNSDSTTPGDLRVRMELCTFFAGSEAEKP